MPSSQAHRLVPASASRSSKTRFGRASLPPRTEATGQEGDLHALEAQVQEVQQLLAKKNESVRRSRRLILDSLDRRAQTAPDGSDSGTPTRTVLD